VHKFRVMISILSCFVIAVVAYFWATGMIDSNFSYRSPLKGSPPAPGKPMGEAATRRVVFVLIDALRVDTSMNVAVMPTLNTLREQGASAVMHSRPPSFSQPGYTTLLTGAWPEINDGPTINLDYADIPTFTQDNLFSAAHRAGLKTAVSGYFWFEKLIPQTDVDFRFYTPGEDKKADRQVVDVALHWLTNDQAQLVQIHIDQVDYAGHYEGGPQSSNWNDAAKRSDELLNEILATMDLEKDTIVILSDHGQIDAGGHGGQDPVVLMEPFVIAGAGIIPGNYPDIQMVDVAPTLSALLGLNLPATSQGSVQTGMLVLTESVASSLPAAVRAQQTALTESYISVIDPKANFQDVPSTTNVSDYQSFMNKIRDKRMFSERILLAIPVALLVAIAVAILIRKSKNGSKLQVIGGLIFVFLFNLRYAVLDKKVYSISSIISQMDLILYIGITSAISCLFVWLLVNLVQKQFRSSPSDAVRNTLSLGLTIVFIVSIPVLLSFVLNGPIVTWRLPDYLTSYVALLALIQILIVSALTPILSGITWLIARLNNNKNP
jgi:hypothetical protein